jgi:hypothetical protein
MNAASALACECAGLAQWAATSGHVASHYPLGYPIDSCCIGAQQTFSYVFTPKSVAHEVQVVCSPLAFLNPQVQELCNL